MDTSKSDSEKLMKLILSIVSGTPSRLTVAFGAYGQNRGLEENLLKEASLVSAKIRHNNLEQEDLNEFMGICSTSQATSLMSENDFEEINTIIERNIK